MVIHSLLYFIGGGYVVSKNALFRFANLGANHPEICVSDGGAEDVQFGQCKYQLILFISH